MRLSKNLLLLKFKCLNKFKDQDWLAEESLKSNSNHKEIPLKATICLIEDLLEFIEKTKFNSHWEQAFSIKIRLQQVQDLLSYFCEKTEIEKTLDGSNLLE